MSHPLRVRIDRSSRKETIEPTCVGVAATVDKDANTQFGGYFFQNGGTTVVEAGVLAERVIAAIDNYQQKNGKLPTYLIIYRSGASEGQFTEIKENECEPLKAAIEKHYGEHRTATPKITVIAIQRKTSHRILKAASELERFDARTPAAVQNVTPGTVATQRGTNPDFQEFIMVAQKAQLGTAKPTVGTIIFQHPPFSTNLSHITNLSNALCYMHEACCSAISIPAPLKSAEQLAKRGKNNWTYWLQTKFGGEDNMSTFSDSSKQFTSDDVDEFKKQASEWFRDLSNSLQVNIRTKYWA